ncbi:SixA phosphatase family protein [Patulibacter americanus]|uniref:SixA phosphatase family protein n=1 Tax=Patulibacter americanus TaxID=588672 RepID=UPI0003B372A3|nr:histidine phosphatase family protein [Patulibacter americanus]
MTELILLRHGQAVDKAPTHADADRDLTTRGEEQARAAGRALAALGLEPDVVLASPKIRAWRTATLACDVLAADPVEHLPLVGLDREEALLAAGLGERVMLVGHDPDLSQVVHDLTGARVRMRKGGVAILTLDGHRATLAALLRPAELERIGG